MDKSKSRNIFEAQIYHFHNECILETLKINFDNLFEKNDLKINFIKTTKKHLESQMNMLNEVPQMIQV